MKLIFVRTILQNWKNTIERNWKQLTANGLKLVELKRDDLRKRHDTAWTPEDPMAHF